MFPHSSLFRRKKLPLTHFNNLYNNQIVKKVYLPNPNKVKLIIRRPPLRSPAFEAKLGPRLNNLNIQMLSPKIYEQVFSKPKAQKCDPVILEECRKTLEKHNMATVKEYLRDIEFKLPPLEGKDIEEHFQTIGDQQAKPYRDLVEDLLVEIPKPPDEWIMQPGWTRYAPEMEPQQVSYPLEEALVFDIEVCMAVGKTPTLATAVSSKAWYGWVSQTLIDGTSKPITSHQYSLDQLIPIESTKTDTGVKLNDHMNKAKVIIGHNVSYDRTRIKEQYWLNRTGTRFIDTMSLHVSVSGVTSYQRAVLKSGKEDEEDEDWKQFSSLNSLSEVHKLYCERSLSKDTRELFVEGSLKDITIHFQDAMKYCSDDVKATYDVLKVLFPLFLERFPHPVTLAGMLELSTAYLPINSNWNKYVRSSDDAYEDLNMERQILLSRRADHACQLLHDDKFKEDLWLWDQDWDVKQLKIKKKPSQSKKLPVQTKRDEDEETEEIDLLEKKFEYLKATRDLVSSVNSLLPGYPNWYRKLCTKPDSSPEWIPGPHRISSSMQITPKLLSLTWKGYPLHYVKTKGWGFLIPFTDDLDATHKLPLKQLLKKCPLPVDKTGNGAIKEALANIHGLVEENLMKKDYYSKVKKSKLGEETGSRTIEIEDCCLFSKLPHKNGAKYNVGNPLARDFLNKFSENVLAGDTESAETVLSIARMLSYWRNNRARIFEQMVVWLNEENLSKQLQGSEIQYGAIIPQVVVCGTLTRRAVEPTWMTASNAQTDRVGSELRAMVQAPPGYNIVGADVDSQELWIASVIGDAFHAKTHGATPIGWMTLSGNKSDGTDMHSMTAKAVGISRNHAKVINYARIYGAGQNFAETHLKQYNPSMSDAEARSKATKMFTLTKGKRIYYLKPELRGDFPDQAYSKWQAFEIAKSCGKRVDDLFINPTWIGGTESAMFNRLEAIANRPNPSTPFLNGRLSRALEPQATSDDRYLPTRVNWVVQSGAVDFLHLMLVCMRWIMCDKARICLSFHDEVRYLVEEKYKYQAALAMHVTNLLTRTFCSARLGVDDLPQSVAFFSAVEIDTVLRKDAKDDCKTPSNPHGLDKGYNIQNGEALDVYEAVEKAGGKYTAWYQQLKQ